MGIGDRHSKRTAATKIPTIKMAVQSHTVDDRELDDPFSAWDDDDALARKPELRTEAPPLAQATSSSLAQTRIERKPAIGTAPSVKVGDALVDPVAMRDIVISRARTLDDPLTTRVLAEIARSEALSEHVAHPHRARSHVETLKIPPLISPGGAQAEEKKSESHNELATPRRRTTRRSILRDDK